MLDIENIRKCLYADFYMLLDVVRGFGDFRVQFRLAVAGLVCAVLLFVFSPFLLTFGTPLACFFIVRLLLRSQPSKPIIYGGEYFKRSCVNACPTLQETYTPTLLWGRSGIAQSVMLFVIGRLSWKMPDWDRRKFVGYDGTTICYDVLQPNPNNAKDLTLILCPGFFCFSHLHFVRHFCLSAQRQGIRCVVINQPAFTPDLTLTSPRLYNYNDSELLEPIVSAIAKEYPLSKIVLIGHSYGSAQTTKFAGEIDKLPTSVCGLITVGPLCSPEQPSDRPKSQGFLKALVARFFCEATKYHIFKNRYVTLTESIKQKHDIDEEKIRNATLQLEVIDNYDKKLHGYSSLKEFVSFGDITISVRKVAIPFVVFHAEDDPIVPRTIKDYKPIIENREDTLLVTTKHGGHLSYYTGGLLFPSKEPWIDEAVLEVAQFMAKKSGPLKG